MEYYRTLHLEKEPFSNTPDPGLFFNSRQHRSALQKLEISIRLRRGLNVISGDVGTGKDNRMPAADPQNFRGP